MAKPPPRLYLDAKLAKGLELPVTGPGWHYLHTVLRLSPEATVMLFNGEEGEWQSRIHKADRRGGVLTVDHQTRPQTVGPDLKLLFAPIKKDPTEFIIQKGTELGVRQFQPVITARTILSKGGLKRDRLDSIATEAAEQCERLDIPSIADPILLDTALKELDDRPLIFCDEAGDDLDGRWGGATGRAQPFLSALNSSDCAKAGALLIGPEGGFTPEERALLRSRAGVLPVSLGPRILKAETAALTAIAIWQAAWGDMR